MKLFVLIVINPLKLYLDMSPRIPADPLYLGAFIGGVGGGKCSSFILVWVCSRKGQNRGLENWLPQIRGLKNYFLVQF